MFSAQQIIGENQHGVVECEKCHSPIQVKQPGMVSIEFCVPCKKCGHRGIYFKRMIYIENANDRRSAPRG